MTGKRKPNRPTIAARVPIEIKEELEKKHPKDGEISKVINILLVKYLRGQILLGIRISD